MRCTNHPLNMLLTRRCKKSCEYALRDKSDEIMYTEIINFLMQRDRKNFLHLNILLNTIIAIGV